MVQNPDTPKQRLAGAALLIEASSEEGTPLLIVRGLNPQETVINKLSIPDFYDKFMGFAQKIALASGRRLAVVIDDHSGEAATNRPALFNYLNKKSAELKSVRVSAEFPTKFNEHNITDTCYLVG